MARTYGNIGEVVHIDTLTVEWKIPSFSRLPNLNDICFRSPLFILLNTEWYLRLKRNRGKAYLALDSCSRLKFKNILYCHLGIKRANVFEKTVYLQNWHLFQLESLVQYVFDGSAEDCPIEDLLSHDTLTAICCLEIQKLNPSHDGQLISRETQTEDLNSAVDENVERCGDFTSEVEGILTVINNMKELLKNGNDDYDVKIFVGDKEFQAHSNILKARSPVFKMMLTHDTKEKLSGDITIEDCDPDSFDEFLLFVYTGKTENLTPIKAVHLYYTADKYDFTDLKKQCLCYMKTSWSTSSVCDVGLLARIYGEEELLKKATEYFKHNIKEIVYTVEWQNFLSKHPIEANELYLKTCLVQQKLI